MKRAEAVVECATCNGTGVYPVDTQDCPDCDGAPMNAYDEANPCGRCCWPEDCADGCVKK